MFLVRKGTLSDYVYLEHGAHWAIGALAVILLVSIGVHVNEFVTGLVGVALIGAAFIYQHHPQPPELAEPMPSTTHDDQAESVTRRLTRDRRDQGATYGIDYTRALHRGTTAAVSTRAR